MEIQDLLGRPIHSEEVKDFLSKYGLPQNPTPNYDAYGNLFCVKANNKAMGIHAVFIHRRFSCAGCSGRAFQDCPLAAFMKRRW